MFSSTYLNCISQVRECPPPPPTSKRAPLFSLELVLEQKHYDPITDIICRTPFFTADIRVWNIYHKHVDSHVLRLLLKHHKLKKGSYAWVATTLLNVPTRGAEKWLFFTLTLDNCSCKVEKMTRTAADSPAWPSSLKLVMNLVASTSTHWIPITLSRDTRHNSDVPQIGWTSWTAFHFPLPKEAEMLSQPVIEFTPIRASHEAVANIAWVE